jgi:MtN3 and saliva related transmembrane protein
MDWITFVGLLAGTLTTVAFLPQVLKTWRSKSAEDISLGMFLTLCTGIFLWLVYGVFTRDLPVILANFVTFILASTILWLKFKYK